MFTSEEKYSAIEKSFKWPIFHDSNVIYPMSIIEIQGKSRVDLLVRHLDAGIIARLDTWPGTLLEMIARINQCS